MSILKKKPFDKSIFCYQSIHYKWPTISDLLQLCVFKLPELCKVNYCLEMSVGNCGIKIKQ